MNSSRFPGKVLFNFGEHSALEFMIKRLEFVFSRDDILVATTVNESDDRLCEFLSSKDIRYLRGSELDVMDRVMKTARLAGRPKIVSLTGDCPLIDPYVLERMMDNFDKSHPDYMCNFIPPSFPDGMEIQLFTLNSLDRVGSLYLNEEEKEHTGLVFRNYSELFSTNYEKASPEEFFPGLGLTLDESRDAHLIGVIIDYFSPQIDFSCKEIVSFLREQPHLLSINASVERRRT